MELIKTSEDVRGQIIFFSYGKKQINLVEIKKGYSRGGHYHSFDTVHQLIHGKVELRQKNILNGEEIIKVIDAPNIIFVKAKFAHLLTALNDSIFIETFNDGYSAKNFSEYRKIVEKNLK